MGQIVHIMISVAALVFVVWAIWTSRRSTGQEVEIDPHDSYQIGLLIGMMGGSVQDAAVAQYALRRFEEEHGRKAKVSEMGIVAGMISSYR